MAKYRLFIKPSAVKELETVARKKDRQQIVVRIQSLAKDPRPQASHKLSGLKKYRIRQGPYRIIYSIQDNELAVTIIKIGHRKEAYRSHRPL